MLLDEYKEKLYNLTEDYFYGGVASDGAIIAFLEEVMELNKEYYTDVK